MKTDLIWLSGVSREDLERSPGDRARYEGVGGAILITASMAALSMAAALRIVFDAPWPLAVVGGFAWGWAVMTLDRWLVTSMRRSSGVLRNLFLMVPRLFLALLFGVIISTPLILAIFDDEIGRELDTMRVTASDQYQQRLKEGDTGKEIARLEQQRDALKQVIASKGDAPKDVEDDPRLVGLRADLDAALEVRTNAELDMRCEQQGTDRQGRKCEKGDGPLAAAAEDRYDQAAKRVRQIERDIADRTDVLTADDADSRATRMKHAQEDLPGIEDRLDVLTAGQKDLLERFQGNNQQEGGLLLRLEALDKATAGNGSLQAARLLLFLFITTIECLPILVKLLMTIGPRTNVEVIGEMREREELRKAERDISGGSGRPGHDDLADVWEDAGPVQQRNRRAASPQANLAAIWDPEPVHRPAPAHDELESVWGKGPAPAPPEPRTPRSAERLDRIWDPAPVGDAAVPDDLADVWGPAGPSIPAPRDDMWGDGPEDRPLGRD
ncbi:DUF4407 domain-containing protein [Actinocorallia sp. A-T 12471]|uniref:DUF4407 domain-containing protein n=1 Tax=Actinocorallia sp. A-T 12471 TaxID=3089813 RepID=UPI0029D2D49B|nr:DUF4407 domain-containing protein [Actinocorallia sp. A-T 12471]MDX6742803.1 DUF4407 domain-containing protein [Actinocorallia sp. A-T 12471]